MPPSKQLLTISAREAPSVEVARHVLSYLLSGAVRPGQKIPSERQLAERIGVGRSTIRDALKPLALLGLLEVRQGDGTYLKAASSDLLPEVIEWGLLVGEPRVDDLLEARAHLETVVAGLAALRRTDHDVDALRGLLDRMEQSEGKLGAFVEADARFHLRIADAARNQVLAGLLRNMQSLTRAWIRRVADTSSYELSYREHVPVLDAIVAGDADAAVRAMTSHMESASSRLRTGLRDLAKG